MHKCLSFWCKMSKKGHLGLFIVETLGSSPFLNLMVVFQCFNADNFDINLFCFSQKLV